MIKLIDEIKVNNELGEGVIWDPILQRVWWTDINQHGLFRYDPVTKALEKWQTPERLACFAPVQIEGERQQYLLAAFESGFAYYQPETSQVHWIKKIEEDNPGTRLNDGRTDRQGRFWAGTMVEDDKSALYKGKLYCLDHGLNATATIDGLQIPNSLCWSPNSNTLYHCDTPSRVINAYAFDADSGQLGMPYVFTQTENGCYPDGSTIDSQGYLWNAQWGGSQVVRYSPDGNIDLTLDLPVSQVTCVAFGGEDLNLLFVTSAHQGFKTDQREKEPSAGNLFVYETDFTGLLESPFMPDSSLGNTLFK